MYGLFEGTGTTSGKPGGNIPASTLLGRWDVKMGNFPHYLSCLIDNIGVKGLVSLNMLDSCPSY